MRPSPFQIFILGQNSEEAGTGEGTEVEDRKEADVSSEAGTYVVGALF